MDAIMFIWILVLLLWTGLLLLILHDVTKQESRGSLVALVGNKAGLAVRRRRRRASRARRRRQAQQALAAEAQAAAAVEAAQEPPPKIDGAPPMVEEPAANIPLAAEATPRDPAPQQSEPREPAPSESVRQPAMSQPTMPLEATPLQEQEAGKPALGRPRKRKWFSKDARAEVTCAELEAAIADAVRKTERCEPFIGVIIGRTIPKSSLGPNWELQGAKFGRADRKVAEEALTNIVERMQKEVVLAAEPEVNPQPRAVVRASL
jgi:hypothetical protein